MRLDLVRRILAAVNTCQDLIEQLEDRVGDLFGLPRLTSFHDLTGRAHQLQIELANDFSESNPELWLPIEEVFLRKAVN